MIERKRLIAAASLLIASASAAPAQDALRCSNFLHNRDGTWRSFYHADIFGPDHVVHVDEGEILSPAAKTAKGDIARGLNELCASGR